MPIVFDARLMLMNAYDFFIDVLYMVAVVGTRQPKLFASIGKWRTLHIKTRLQRTDRYTRCTANIPTKTASYFDNDIIVQYCQSKNYVTQSASRQLVTMTTYLMES